MKRAAALFLALAFAVFAAFSGFAESIPDTGLSLLAINVRKADCLLLFSGQDIYMIDTGRPESFDMIASVLNARGIGRLKGIILTHTDTDHVGALPALLSSGIKADNIYASAYYNCDAEAHPVVQAAEKAGMKTVFLKAGDVLPLEGGELRVLGPLARDAINENNNSLVILAKTQDGSILLTGDMEEAEETSLLEAGAIPGADVLKVAHHGGGGATTDALLRAVRPKAAVISTNSEDDPDKPSKKVLTRLLNKGVKTAITQYASEGVLVTLRGGVPDMKLSNLKQSVSQA